MFNSRMFITSGDRNITSKSELECHTIMSGTDYPDFQASSLLQHVLVALFIERMHEKHPRS